LIDFLLWLFVIAVLVAVDGILAALAAVEAMGLR